MAEREWKREKCGVESGVRGPVDYRLSCPVKAVGLKGRHTPVRETGPRVWRGWVAADPSLASAQGRHASWYRAAERAGGGQRRSGSRRSRA